MARAKEGRFDGIESGHLPTFSQDNQRHMVYITQAFVVERTLGPYTSPYTLHSEELEQSQS